VTRRALRNADSGELIASITVPRGPLGRAIGLLLRSSLDAREGLWLEPCAAIHTIGMRFAIDTIFLDERGFVIQTIESVRPHRVAVTCLKARVTIELGEGTLQAVPVERGARLHLAESLATL
jgi:uncharacterized protein